MLNVRRWSLVYTDGKGMFCSLCRIFDTKQHNGFKTWNNTANIRCRPDTAEGHFKSEMHKDAYEASERGENSYFDREEEKKVKMFKNEVYFKVFKALYWLAKEEIASTKITSLLELIEKMGVDDLKYFQTRSEPVLRKMLLLIAKTIIQDIVIKIKTSNIYGLLTDEVTDICNICQLASFVKYYDYNKEKAETVFIDCLDLLEFSENSSPNADAIVFCITEISRT